MWWVYHCHLVVSGEWAASMQLLYRSLLSLLSGEEQGVCPDVWPHLQVHVMTVISKSVLKMAKTKVIIYRRRFKWNGYIPSYGMAIWKKRWPPSWTSWSPFWIFKCSLFWIWRMLQNMFWVNYQVSASIISNLEKFTCENAIFELGDLYDLEIDMEA